ncbi:capsid and scaffold [Pseudomonas phage PotUPM1]|nr:MULTISPECIES: HK97 family phage prohead protease [Pseudomonas]MDU9400611.1 HK97 family phage prohead protease [Pseudomonas sp. zfem003]WEV90026.1 capsid and scaffold [Pseudomonas phage PotUPM1]
MPNICKTIAFDQAELKFVGSSTEGIFEGYASVFGVVDSDGDIMLPGAFKNALASQTRKVSMFFNHRAWEIPVGKWEHLEEDSKGLLVRGSLTPGHSTAADIKAAMAHGTVDGLSVGFGAGRDDYEIISTGRAFKNVSRLSEISICTQPANEQATVASLKSLEGLVTIRDVEHWLRDSAGLSKSEAQAVIACVKSAVRSESEGGDDIAALIARISNFQPRI